MALAAAALAAGNLLAAAATVEGRITAQGKALPVDADAGDAYGSRKYKFLEKVNYAAFNDFVVWLEGGTPADVPLATNAVRVVVQRDGTFNPHLMAIRVGTDVEWPNEDDILHNVFSYSEIRPFDLGLYKDEVKHVVFDKPGRVDVFCSIHKNMHCIILVLETPWFAATDAKGRYVIRNVPPGKYQLHAWHERLPPQVREIDVLDAATTRVDVVMGITGIPQY